jgi:hypothetical protein
MATNKTTTKKARKPATAKAKTPQTMAKKPKPTSEKTEPKNLSQFQAAIKVLAEAGEPMSCKAMVETMQAKGYWTSPAGKTPHQTLNASILRDIRKGKGARFVKADRGMFGLNK